jgi:hypothetical protein
MKTSYSGLDGLAGFRGEALAMTRCRPEQMMKKPASIAPIRFSIVFIRSEWMW